LIIINAILILLAAGLLACLGVAVYAFILLKKRPPLALYESRRGQPDFLPLDRIPARQIELLIREEDPRFYTHPGYDIVNIRKARKLNRSKHHIVCGASTITQQLAKNLYLRFTQNYLRKAVELLIALALERRLGKERILEFYLNIIYFGNGAYGISEAARFYFDRPVSDLSLNQMMILTIIPSIPTRGNPIQHPEVFERVRNKCLCCFSDVNPPVISRAEAEDIRSHTAACLDPELRAPDDYTRSYPQTVPMINERYGPYAEQS